MLSILFRTLAVYVALIATMRLMGKRQIGQMEPSEFVVTMLVSNLAAIPMQDGGIPLFSGAVPLLLVVAAAGLSHFTDSGTGAVLGLFSGLLCDISLGRPTAVYTVTLCVIGLVLGYLGDTILSRRTHSRSGENVAVLNSSKIASRMDSHSCAMNKTKEL